MEIEIDIVTVLYNSERWLNGYLNALLKSEYNLKNLNLILIDNNPHDTRSETISNHPVVKQLRSYSYTANADNVGFGIANNQGVQSGNAPYIFFLNIDTAVTSSAFKELADAITRSAPEVGAWEMRQLPYEHPKIYHPVNQYTSWASGAALCVKRTTFDESGGFDKRIFMYGEDVDLSWKIRSCGYQIMYCPKAVVYHFSYEEGIEIKPTQLYQGLFSNLMLRYKYGSWLDVIKGYLIVMKFKHTSCPTFENQKQELKRVFRGAHRKGMEFRSDRAYKTFVPKFLQLDYETSRSGAFYVNQPWQKFERVPKVSVIVRTHKRPLVLEEALRSLLNQTYPNIEIVVVEDGENTAQNIINQYQSKANIQYYFTGKNAGRSVAGNLGMSKASGEYLAFLDDDDLVYADHFETMMGKLLEGNYDAVHVPAFSVKTEILSTNPYRYREIDYKILHDVPFNKEDLAVYNLFPIQAVLFQKALFEEYGGFDTTIDYLEDWALWLKYFSNANVGYADKLTSLYRIPANNKVLKQRHAQLQSTYDYVKAKYGKGYPEDLSSHSHVNELAEPFTAEEMSRINICVDYIKFGDSELLVDGWAVLNDKGFDQINLKIVLKGKEQRYKMRLMNRVDINKKFGLRIEKLGYWVNLQSHDLPDGFCPFSIVFVKGNKGYEVKVNRFFYLKTKVLGKLRQVLSVFLNH